MTHIEVALYPGAVVEVPKERMEGVASIIRHILPLPMVDVNYFCTLHSNCDACICMS
jgi:hypothetical protein